MPVNDNLLGPDCHLTPSPQNPMPASNIDPASLAARLLALQQQGSVGSVPTGQQQQPDLSQQTVTMTLQELQNFVIQQGRRVQCERASARQHEHPKRDQ